MTFEDTTASTLAQHSANTVMQMMYQKISREQFRVEWSEIYCKVLESIEPKKSVEEVIGDCLGDSGVEF